MSARKLSRALSPRVSQAFPLDTPSPPKPTPRLRRAETEEAQEADMPRKAERKLTASEVVAAASRRPSGRNDDLPQPPPVPPTGEFMNEHGIEAVQHLPSDADPVLHNCRTASGVAPNSLEDAPVFAVAAKNASTAVKNLSGLSPVPTPRPRSTSEDQTQTLDMTPSEIDKAAEEDVVLPESAHVSEAATLTASLSAMSKVPPPVAPKPKRSSSVSSTHSDTTIDRPSSTQVSPKLKEFSEASSGTLAVEDSSSRKVVSAARMFEGKATEVKPVSPLTKPTRASVPVSSVVKSFNRVQEMENPSSGTGGGGVGEVEDWKRLNSALLPASERRKSMPSRFTGTSSLSSSLQLTKPTSLAHLRHSQTPSRGGFSILEDEEGEPTEKASLRFNSVLKPRHAFPTSSSPLRSVLTSRQRKEDTKTITDDTSDVILRPKHADMTSREVASLKHQSWSPQSSSGDPHSPRMIFTSTSLHHRVSTSSSSSPHSSWGGDHSDQLESTMKKFDDLLLDKHHLDSDEELPNVSNSVSLDLIKSMTVGNLSATLKSQEKPSATEASATSMSKPQDEKPVDEELSAKNVKVRNSCQGDDAGKGENDRVDVAITTDDSGQVFGEIQAEEDSIAVAFQSAASSAPTQRKERDTEADSKCLQSQFGMQLDKNRAQKTKIAAQNAEDKKENVETSQANDSLPEPAQSLQAPEQPQRKPRKSRPPMSDKEEYPSPETDTANSLNLIATEEEVENVTLCEWPAEDMDLPRNMAEEAIFQQQASSIVHSVINNALKDVESRPREDKEDREDSSPLPPSSSEEPPPLPGAPPPPLILRNMVETLTPAEMLEGLLPSESFMSAGSTLCSQPDLIPVGGSSTEPFPRKKPECVVHMLESGDVQVDIDDTMTTDTTVPDLALPPRKEAGSPHNEEPVRDSDLLLSFQSSQCEESSTGGVPVKNAELDQGQEDHPPVSDTLSQDSGVQDEDMSEDGQRFCHDDSPTSQGDSSLFDTVLTPDDLPASILKETQMELTYVAPISTSPLPSPRSKVPPRSPRSPISSVNVSSILDSAESDEGAQKLAPKYVQSVLSDSDKTNIGRDGVENHSKVHVEITASPPRITPPPPPNAQDDVSGSTEDFVMVKSPRKWSIIDQSGSLFLQGASNSEVEVRREAVRQMCSLSPGELSTIMSSANKDLDEAGVASAVELRVVAARGLNGRPLSVEVTQRQDYLVQITKVHSKDSALEEGDLLLFVDDRTQKNRRPAQVTSQLEMTGPKGILLTARGVKIPPSLLRQGVEKTSEPSDSNPESPRSLSTPTSTTTPAVKVGPGLYDVIMVKGATGVGLCLEGGVGSPRGDLPIFIKRIFKGGPAEKCGHLKVKDEIVAINGVDFTTMRHYEAWNHLKFLDDGEIRLRIRREED